MHRCGNYATVFCYYCFECLINVSLLTGWPFAKVRAELVLVGFSLFVFLVGITPPSQFFISKLFIRHYEVLIWPDCFFFPLFLSPVF